MELSIYQQIFEQIKKSSRILIALPQNFSIDHLSAGLAFKSVLEKLKKENDLISSGALDPKLVFLPGTDGLKNSLSSDKNLVIRLNTSEKKLQEISYDTADNQVSIYLKSAGQPFSPEDLVFEKERPAYDLVLVIGAANLGELGDLFEQKSSVFYEIPKVNIDNKAGNELFGAVNWVDLASTSICEMLFGLLEKNEEKVVDENISTCLMAGIISETDSFQHVKTTPRSFLVSSKLVELGARQQEIVQAIYKTKPLNFLRLWGRTLAKLKGAEGAVYMYAVLNSQDFEKSSAGQDFITKIISDLIGNISDKKIMGVISENTSGGVRLSLALHKLISETKFIEEFGLPSLKQDIPPLAFGLWEFVLPNATLADIESRFIKISELI
ncbi:MAG: hypothetical protein JNN11_00130 [Candidatus Doudnabacteria bacterium]|nr:hypothetical protein [Candidatus Doudnabacteria bacterium]